MRLPARRSAIVGRGGFGSRIARIDTEIRRGVDGADAGRWRCALLLRNVRTTSKSERSHALIACASMQPRILPHSRVWADRGDDRSRAFGSRYQGIVPIDRRSLAASLEQYFETRNNCRRGGAGC